MDQPAPDQTAPLVTHLSDALSLMDLVPVSGVEPPGAETRLEEIGFDSLAIVEFLMHLESITGQYLEFKPAQQIETLGDLCSALRPEQG